MMIIDPPSPLATYTAWKSFLDDQLSHMDKYGDDPVFLESIEEAKAMLKRMEEQGVSSGIELEN